METEKKHLFPAFFFAHGTPYMLGNEIPVTDFYKKLGTTFERPDAIVIFTAHWQNKVQKISSVEKYRTIHDYSGFPREYYELKYECPGNPTLAKEIQALFKENGIESELDEERGIDHGAWSPLYLVYPDADIPVVQLSMDETLSPEDCFKRGKALASLREKKILLIASGNSVHNLALLRDPLEGGPVDQWAIDFDDWLEKKLLPWEIKHIENYENEAPDVKLAVPEPDHFLAVLHAAGFGDKNKKPTPIHRSVVYSNLTYFIWRFD